MTAKTNTFVEVEMRGKEGEHKAEDSTFYFKCNSCHLPAQATNGHLILKDPKDPMGDPKGFEVDYLFCHRCDVLVEMKDEEGKDVEFDKQIFYSEGKAPEAADKSAFTKRIREELFN